MSMHPFQRTYMRQRRTGFTLVETLVAITVLMIAIAGPLVIASKGLRSALYSKNQMIASFLAQETMELVKNKRDNNMADGGESNWDNTFTGCSESNPCDVKFDWIGIADFVNSCTTPIPGYTGVKSCEVYYDQNTGYNIKSMGTKTPFYRRFYLVDVADGSVPEVRLHVVVDWAEGSIPFSIHLTSNLLATNRK